MASSFAIKASSETALARLSSTIRSNAWWTQDGESVPLRDDVIPLEALSDLVTWHNAFGDVLKVGADAGRMFDMTADDLQYGGFLSRVHVTDRPIFLKALSDAANGQKSVQAEFRVHAGPGGEREAFGVLLGDGPAAPTGARVVWAEMRAHGLDTTGKLRSAPRVIAFTRDITESKRRAEELEQAKQDAEKANELKGRFLATVSHELRTPLNAIIGFSELLCVDHPFLLTDERRKEYALIIRSSGTHLLDIVNTLLDMSKIESGNFNFDPEPFRFAELVTSCCDLMILKAERAGITIERRVEAALPDCVGDRRACRQILINLLSNAVKFTPPSGRVTVSLSHLRDEFVLRVADTGVGISEADLPRLGDPFFQAGEVHRRDHEGTGLGLSVVRGLIGLHGGRLCVESGPGAGTTVTVTLPRERADECERSGPVPVQTIHRAAVRRAERKSA